MSSGAQFMFGIMHVLILVVHRSRAWAIVFECYPSHRTVMWLTYSQRIRNLCNGSDCIYRILFCDISGSYGSKYEGESLLGYSAV
jgi:hypothetical protein